MSNLARRLGFSYSSEFIGDVVSSCGNFALFGKGHSKKAYNVLKGYSQDISWTIFDYKYTVGHGKHSHTYNQTVASAELSGVNFPKFSLAPESFFHKLGDVFGSKDIDFNTHPMFSKKYLLKGSDEQAIRNIFVSHILNYFEQKTNVHNIEADGDKFVIYGYCKRVKPEDFQKFLFEISGAARMLTSAASAQ